MTYDPGRAVEAARVLSTRRLAGLRGPVLPASCRPTDLAAALMVQEAVSRELAQRAGEQVAGWKCGLPEPGKWVLAPLYAGTVCRDASRPCPVWARDGRVKVEPELAFVLGQDLPTREAPYTEAEVDAAVAHTHLALELIDDRYDEAAAPTFADRLADGLVNQGLFLGPEVDPAQAGTAGPLAIQIEQAGAPVFSQTGAHPAARPRAPLYWLAECLRARGQGLRAGQVVITGSYAGAPWVPVGAALRVRFGELGALSVCFEARPSA